MLRFLAVTTSAFALLIMACAPAESPTDPAEVRAQLDTYLATYSPVDLDAMTASLAEDVVIMPPDERPTFGRAAQQSGFEEFLAMYDFTLNTTVDDLHVSGDLAVARTTFEQTMTPKAGGDTEAESGSWIIVMERQEDGSWKVTQEMWSVYPSEEMTDE